MTAPPAPGPSSPIRAITGGVALVGSFAFTAGGFAQMVTSLEAGRYGTWSITVALALLGIGGGLLATGIGLLIWEYSIRHGVRH